VPNIINSTANMLLQTGGTTRLTIGSSNGDVSVSNNLVVFGTTNLNGNVSIGAPTASRKLTVGGSTMPYMSFLPTSSNNEFVIGSDSYGFIVFDQSNSAYRMIVDKSGNVCIGLTAARAGCMLTVNGKIAAEEFEIVNDVAVPDYVFGKNYKLCSLKELENYININSHLPEVPSANEVKQNGYKLADMDNTLLKKVEELTLYVIELNKQLESTKAELLKLKAGNN
jgi:hypothetical protein